MHEILQVTCLAHVLEHTIFTFRHHKSLLQYHYRLNTVLYNITLLLSDSPKAH